MLPSKYASNISSNVKKLRMWNNSELSSCGECCRTICNPKNNKKCSVNFDVYEGDFMPLLGYHASKQMYLITVNKDNVYKIVVVDISNRYDGMFDASTIGTLGTPHHLKIKDSVSPVVVPSRCIPKSVRQKFKTDGAIYHSELVVLQKYFRRNF